MFNKKKLIKDTFERLVAEILYETGSRYTIIDFNLKPFTDRICDVFEKLLNQPDIRWIPCEEGIPDDSGDPVMVTTISGNLLIAIFEPEEGLWWASDYDGAIYDVVAWMPLPEPYRAEKGE